MQRWRTPVLRILVAGIVLVAIYSGVGLKATAGGSALGRYPERVYVPNTIANTVHVIDPKSFKIVTTHPVGRESRQGTAPCHTILGPDEALR
jgi:DNA-binding beta-propeller fold protein YncE